MTTTIVVIVVCVAINEVLTRWRLTRCTCGQVKVPYLFPNHEKHAILIAKALGLSAVTLGAVLIGASSATAILCAVVSVYRWWIVKIHDGKKRRWASRLAGMVRINQHGRLIIHTAAPGIN